MNKWEYFFFLVSGAAVVSGREPFKPRDGSLPFLVYFMSRYRGLCAGTLAARTAVLTAAVCVTDPTRREPDTRPINVVVGATYRHPRRGIRVQVVKILLPKLSAEAGERAYAVQRSAGVLLLARSVPDVLAEVPLRPIAVDSPGGEPPALHEECLVPGWHFFYKGDKIYPVHKFLLQRNIRVQYVIVVKKSLWCGTIALKFQKAMTNLGYTGHFDEAASICVRDNSRAVRGCRSFCPSVRSPRAVGRCVLQPDREAQPCHGMYGAPLICRGRAVAVLAAPDAQWANCTGHSALLQPLAAAHLRPFMACAARTILPTVRNATIHCEELARNSVVILNTNINYSSLFVPEFSLTWDQMKESLESEPDERHFDYLPDLYDRMLYDTSDSDRA